MPITDLTIRARNSGILLGATLLIAGCTPKAAPSVAPATQTIGGLTVQMTTTPAPPHTGDDTLNLTLTDASRAPVGDANVTATPNMLAPRMPGESNSGRAQGNGLYQVPIRLPIATKYDVDVQIQQRNGQPPVTVTFPVEATQ